MAWERIPLSRLQSFMRFYAELPNGGCLEARWSYQVLVLSLCALIMSETRFVMLVFFNCVVHNIVVMSFAATFSCQRFCSWYGLSEFGRTKCTGA